MFSAPRAIALNLLTAPVLFFCAAQRSQLPYPRQTRTPDHPRFSRLPFLVGIPPTGSVADEGQDSWHS
jgi:hypothetical protein